MAYSSRFIFFKYLHFPREKMTEKMLEIRSYLSWVEKLKIFFFIFPLRFSLSHRYKGQLCLPPLIWNMSYLKIFPLELLGSAEKPMAGPSSSKGKILRRDTVQISGGKHNCPLYLWLVHTAGVVSFLIKNVQKIWYQQFFCSSNEFFFM